MIAEDDQYEALLEIIKENPACKIIEEELEKRKMIDRAKEILMSKKGLSAERAFRWIQRKSMDTRKSMKEIAEAIIISQDI